MRAEAWQAIPGVSDWVMGIIKRGYSLQFARRPPRFSGVVSTSVQKRMAASGPSTISDAWITPSWDGRSGWSRWSRSSRRFAQGTGILSLPDSPSSQTILEIRLRGSGLPVHGPTLWTVSGPPYFCEVHGRGSFASKTDGNPHSQLPRRLAHSGPVRGGATFTQNPPPQPLRAPGAQSQFRQKRTVNWRR